jgi:peptidyl-tRNA hydrolase, PTH1 family
MLLFVGLGNPGAGYAGHRHNVGFMALDAIAARHGIAPWRRRFQGAAAEGTIGPDRVLLLKPGTYMNESGRAVAEAVHFYKIAPHHTLVFHDEIDLAPGKVRVKIGGGTAGHNGLRSISAHIGNEYRRVRIGVGHPGDKDLVQHFVLSPFAKSERAWVEILCEIIADNAALLAHGEDASFQNKVHLAMAAKGFVEPKRPGAPADGADEPT